MKLGWILRTKIIRHQWFIWKKTDDRRYGSCTYLSIKKNSKTDNSAGTEKGNVDEAITSEAKSSKKMEIYLREEKYEGI